MEEVQETVKAYYAKLPESQKHEATKFSNSLDKGVRRWENHGGRVHGLG
ncbi:putative calcium ion binding protein [Corchorus olitorius]|uniref:Calcium ion binding protein n=1 Tax=Corchorus olitorius TaxID=93759 RepID=A0A1R3JKZ4_9ROSI|nr:putative calcium ion binding protein [Corchorus olitorius]